MRGRAGSFSDPGPSTDPGSKLCSRTVHCAAHGTPRSSRPAADCHQASAATGSPCRCWPGSDRRWAPTPSSAGDATSRHRRKARPRARTASGRPAASHSRAVVRQVPDVRRASVGLNGITVRRYSPRRSNTRSSGDAPNRPGIGQHVQFALRSSTAKSQMMPRACGSPASRNPSSSSRTSPVVPGWAEPEPSSMVRPAVRPERSPPYSEADRTGSAADAVGIIVGLRQTVAAGNPRQDAPIAG
jgi:hypothetical protein